MTEKIQHKITKPVWYEADELSPKLAPETFGIEFITAPAQGPNGPTVGLYGISELIGVYGERYGGRIPGAMEVVAMDVSSGGLYHARPERMDSAPLQVAPAAQSSVPEDIVLGSVTTHFNIDLCEQLALPAQAATYQVMVWLDDCVSSVQLVQVPENPARLTRPARATKVHYPQIVHFRHSELTPKAVPSKPILLLPSVPTSESIEVAAQLSILGNLHAQDLPEQSLVGDEPQPVLHLLVRGLNNRTLYWHSELIEEKIWRSKEAAFDFSPRDLVADAVVGDVYYVVALQAGAVSNIVKFSWPNDA